MLAKLLTGNARLASLMRKAELSSELSFNLWGDRLKHCRCFPFISVTQSLHSGEALQSVAHVPGLIRPGRLRAADDLWSPDVQRLLISVCAFADKKFGSKAKGETVVPYRKWADTIASFTAPNPKLRSVKVDDGRWMLNGSEPVRKVSQGKWSRGLGEVVKPKRGAAVTERCH